MICPRCSTSLLMSNTKGVEIDYCPECKGVWLDRGELDKIVERSNGEGNGNFQGNNNYGQHNNHPDRKFDSNHDGHFDENHDGQHGYGYPQKRKKGFLGDLFDF
jgi:Zn-finger nucleic acid-binding protein